MNNKNKISFPKDMPREWSNWNCGVETAFSLVGNRSVHKELYDEFKVVSFEKSLNKLMNNREILVHYRFYTINFFPAFSVYASGSIGTKRKTYKTRDIIQGDTPFEFYSDNTIMEIWNEPYSIHSYSSFIKLRCGGINKEKAKYNWEQVDKNIDNILKELRNSK